MSEQAGHQLSMRLGLQMTLGVAALVAGVATFGWLAHAVGSGAGLALLDVRLSQWLHAQAFEPLTGIMLLVSHVHSVAGIAFLGLLLAWVFWRRQEHYWMLALWLALPTGMVLNVLLKHVFQRGRPVFDTPLVSLPTYSFPSGHTSSATLLYGVLACYLVTVLPRHGQRVAVVLAAVAMVLLVAFSRMYLGAHFLTDVLAAIAEGVAWLALCISAVSGLRRRRERP